MMIRFLVIVAGLGVSLSSMVVAADVTDVDPADFAVQTLLLVGDERGPQAVSLAQRRYQLAKELRDDGATGYAYAIVLLRLNRPKDALAVLSESAADRHLPAVRTHGALLLNQKQWASAGDQLERMAGLVIDQPELWADPNERVEQARWLGRAVSAAELLAPNVAEVDRFHRLDQRFRERFPPELSTVYAEGFDGVIAESDALADAVEETRAVAELAAEEARAEEQARVQSEKAITQNSRKNLRLTAEEWKKHLDAELADFAKELGLLEKDWNALEDRRLSIEQSIRSARQEQTVLLLRLDQLTGSQNFVRVRGAGRRVPELDPISLATARQMNTELSLRQQQILQSQADRDRTLASMMPLQQRARELLDQRQRLVVDYERATGQLVQKDESLKKWGERLQKKEQELAESPKGKPTAVQTLEQKRKSIATYLPMDWEAERQRLLAELGT